jgi:hypothetical protein
MVLIKLSGENDGDSLCQQPNFWQSLIDFITASSPSSQKQFTVTLPLIDAQPCSTKMARAHRKRQSGIMAGFRTLIDGQNPFSQFSISYQQVLSSEGPDGAQANGLTASEQRHLASKPELSQPRRSGVSLPEVMHWGYPQLGNEDKFSV